MDAIIYKPLSTICRGIQRRGMVLIVVLVVFAISMALFAIWARTALDEQQQTLGREIQMQAERLAESGLERAVARRVADRKYDGEIWSVPAADLGRRQAAEVRLQVTPGADENQLRVEATAEYPIGAVRHAQITKKLEIANPTPGNES